jgi:hypothetical protein
MLAGNPAEALEILEADGAGTSEVLPLRARYGIALALTGNPAGAEEHVRWLETVERPNLQGMNTYLRGAIAANLGKRDEAVALLRRSFQEGRSYWNAHAYPYFSPLWGYEPFEDLVRPKG